jgi:hypothetical protein
MNFGKLHLDLGEILPGIIWGVILLIWAVGKVLTGLREAKGGKRTPAPPGPAGETGRTAGDELREFLETLTGQKLAPEPDLKAPVEESVPRPPPLAPARPAEPVLKTNAPRPVVAPVAAPVEMPEGLFRPTQLRGTDALLVGLSSMRLPGASLPKADLWTSTRKHVKAELNDRQDVRRAMVQRIVLSPPLALQRKAASPDAPEY